jgi:hypothetical protein
MKKKERTLGILIDMPRDLLLINYFLEEPIGRRCDWCGFSLFYEEHRWLNSNPVQPDEGEK